jgi:hypothetical protein
MAALPSPRFEHVHKPLLRGRTGRC